MSSHRIVFLSCDGCDASVGDAGDDDAGVYRDSTSARKAARRRGWVIGTRRKGKTNANGGAALDLCSSCRAKPRLPLDLG